MMVDLSEEELMALIQLLNARMVEFGRKHPETPFPQVVLYQKLIKVREDNIKLMKGANEATNGEDASTQRRQEGTSQDVIE